MAPEDKSNDEIWAALLASLGDEESSSTPRTTTSGGKITGYDPKTGEIVYQTPIPGAGGSGGGSSTSGTDFIELQQLIDNGFVEIAPGLWEKYDPATKRVIQYQGNAQSGGGVKYQLKYIGAAPKGYKPPSTAGTATGADTSSTAPQDAFPIETHGSSTPVFDRSGNLQYQYNDPETNTSYSKGYNYDDIKKERDADIREQNARQKLMDEGPFPAFANGGNFITDGPQMIMDMQTGQPTGVFGEAGAEMATFTPMEGDDPFATYNQMHERPQYDPELQQRMAREVDSVNLRPWPWERDPVTGEWRIAPEVMARQMAGMYRGNVPWFENGGSMTAGLAGYESPVISIDNPDAFAQPSPEPQPVPLPEPIPLPNQPWREALNNTAIPGMFQQSLDNFRSGFNMFGNWLGDKFNPQADPITDPYDQLPADIRERQALLQQILRQRGIDAYKYAIAGLPQPGLTSEERVAQMQLDAINAAAPGYAGGHAIGPFAGLVDSQYRNQADQKLRGQLGMSTAGEPPPAAPTVGDKPFPTDPFAFLTSLMRT